MLRVFLGFVFACLAAALTTVAFVITPAELVASPAPAQADRLATFGTLTLLAATHSAIFAAPFALIAAVIGEWQSIRNPMYYAAAGILIALGGFAAQFASETGAGASIANNYALKAFLTSGFVGGIVYWMLSGRAAGDDPEEDLPPATPPRPAVKPGSSVPNVSMAAPPKPQGSAQPAVAKPVAGQPSGSVPDTKGQAAPPGSKPA